MLFNSSVFITLFLPIVLAGFFVFAATGRRYLAGIWLTISSLVFYGWWNPVHVPLLLASMAFNYLVGQSLSRQPRKTLLIAGIAANVALLGFFKYTSFVAGALDQAFGLNLTIPHIVLPLAISFFTFQQIAYLCDAHDGVAVEHDFLNYSLFITFFPHLIAGPITHHREMLPQFQDPKNFKPRWDNISLGTTLFLVGLLKKVIIADPLGVIARPVFDAAAEQGALSLLDAWGGATAYTLQIYFDFSGYTDMAIGLGLLFGIRLPQNFNSPYKARNIIEFWSRWHMTLTRFLTAYIYNPIVANFTRARARRGLPLPRRGRMPPGACFSLVVYPTMFTMFISGIWHGAGWQFICFGLVHGVYLCINHGWRGLKARFKHPLDSKNPLAIGGSVLLTFVCVIVGLVFFRSAGLAAALRLLASMIGADGIILPPSLAHLPGIDLAARHLGLTVGKLFYISLPQAGWIALMLAVVWILPNAQQWLRNYPTALQAQPAESWLQRLLGPMTWRPTAAVGLTIGCVGLVVLIRALSAAPTEFLYFQF